MKKFAGKSEQMRLIVFFCILLGYLASYIVTEAYVKQLYLTPDSVEYLKEAQALLRGFGFHSGGIAGYDFWFANWPIGYPVLIALTALVTQRNVYLASKILTILILAGFMVILYLEFRKDSWLYGLILLNTGLLSIYCYTWSETPFIVCLFVFALSLSKIMTRKEPSGKWYVLLTVGAAGAFLFRYFGTMTLVCTFLVFGAYALLYFTRQACHTEEVLRKIKRLFLALVVMTAVVALYFLMNKMMCGMASGVSRTTFTDDMVTLTQNLLDAIFAEVFNVFGVIAPTIVLNYTMGCKTIIMLVLAVMCISLIVHGIRNNRPYAAFAFVGLVYDLMFIWVRFHSTMDPFGSRFFAPGSTLIVIALLEFLSDRIGAHIKGIVCWMMIAVLAMSTYSQIVSVQGTAPDQSAYRKFMAQINNDYYEVPDKSAVLYYANDPVYDKKTGMLRPDILFAEGIGEKDTMADVFEQYQTSDYICIKKDVLQSMILSHPDSFDTSVVTFFTKALAQSKENKTYVTIDVRTHKTVDSAGMYNRQTER